MRELRLNHHLARVRKGRVRGDFLLAFRESRYRPTYEQLGMCVRNFKSPNMPLSRERARQLVTRAGRQRRDEAAP